MKIEQDDFYRKKDKKNITSIISAMIVITVLMVIVIIVLILSMKDPKLVVTVDGQKVSIAEDAIIFAEDTNEAYISIRDIAALVGYEAHNRRI